MVLVNLEIQDLTHNIYTDNYIRFRLLFHKCLRGNAKYFVAITKTRVLGVVHRL